MKSTFTRKWSITSKRIISDLNSFLPNLNFFIQVLDMIWDIFSKRTISLGSTHHSFSCLHYLKLLKIFSAEKYYFMQTTEVVEHMRFLIDGINYTYIPAAISALFYV